MKKIRRRGILTRAVIAVLDAFVLALSFGFALWVRFDFRLNDIPSEMKNIWAHFTPWMLGITLFLFVLLHMYRYVWRIVGLHDVLMMIGSILAAFAVSEALLIPFGFRLPISVSFIALLTQLALLVGLRISLRVYIEFRGLLRQEMGRGIERIMLIGGGAAGRALIQEMTTSKKTEGKVCCIIDDNPSKNGRRIEGIPIVGGRERIAEFAEKMHITQIVLAIPSISTENKHEILKLCNETGIPTKTLPGIYQLVNGQVRVSDIHDVQIEDLLGRDTIRLNLSSLRSALGGHTILVTGGGGSIGSELCRQIAHYHPRELIILDIYENNAYEIQQELRRTYGDALNLSVEIASVRDAAKLDEIFEKYRPDIVFHAAAHKHVPLMENSPSEAIKNNIFGTYHVADAAERCGVKKFVMISTDKAVNPTNVMGATKRFCEMIMQSRYDSATEYCAVRFGNVLGSNGSVVPLFKEQIAKGGPVTVTDKRITRFFMTIPEAVQLVLEADTMAQQSQIFVLDMGEPVRILDLAENMIRLSGFEPYQDIAIEEIGLRPGEKLYEELLMASNDLSATANEKIFVEQQGVIERETIEADLRALQDALTRGDNNEELIALLKTMVPTYHSSDEVNDKVETTGSAAEEKEACPA